VLEPNAAAQHYEGPVENGFLSNKVQIFDPQVSPTWTNHPFFNVFLPKALTLFSPGTKIL
jgi:hypothetical protein